MRAKSLKTRILRSFIVVVLVLSGLIAILGFYVIKRDIVDRADQRVRRDLKAARMIYTDEIDRMGQTLRLVSPTCWMPRDMLWTGPATARPLLRRPSSYSRT